MPPHEQAIAGAVPLGGPPFGPPAPPTPRHPEPGPAEAPAPPDSPPLDDAPPLDDVPTPPAGVPVAAEPILANPTSLESEPDRGVDERPGPGGPSAPESGGTDESAPTATPDPAASADPESAASERPEAASADDPGAPGPTPDPTPEPEESAPASAGIWGIPADLGWARATAGPTDGGPVASTPTDGGPVASGPADGARADSRPADSGPADASDAVDPTESAYPGAPAPQAAPGYVVPHGLLAHFTPPDPGAADAPAPESAPTGTSVDPGPADAQPDPDPTAAETTPAQPDPAPETTAPPPDPQPEPEPEPEPQDGGEAGDPPDPGPGYPSQTTTGLFGEHLTVSLREVIDPADERVLAVGYELDEGERAVLVCTGVANAGPIEYQSLPDLYLTLRTRGGERIGKAALSVPGYPGHRVGIEAGAQSVGWTVFLLPNYQDVTAVVWSARHASDDRSLSWPVSPPSGSPGPGPDQPGTGW